MGRKKIQIKKISCHKLRNITFKKRKVNFLKKAYQLSVLCSAKIKISIKDQYGNFYQYISSAHKKNYLDLHKKQGQKINQKSQKVSSQDQQNSSSSNSSSQEHIEQKSPEDNNGQRIQGNPIQQNNGMNQIENEIGIFRTEQQEKWNYEKQRYAYEMYYRYYQMQQIYGNMVYHK